MYQILYDGAVVFDPRLANSAAPDDLAGTVLEGQWKPSVGVGGQLTFTLPARHPMIGTILLKTGTIKMTEILPGGTNTVFLGRVIREETNFDNSHTYECEGALAMLNDSVVAPGTFPPYVMGGQYLTDYQAAVSAGTVPEFRLSKLLDDHLSMVGLNGAILLGNVTVTGSSMERSSSEWLTTWERMLMEFTDSELGGFFNVRYSGNNVYLDYLASTDDFTDYNQQVISFGDNLAEITSEKTAGDEFNAVLPVTPNGNPILINRNSDLPDGYYGTDNKYYKSGYVLTTSAAQTNIVRVAELAVSRSDPATDRINAAIAYLEANAGTYVNALTVKAYDMSAVDPDIEPFRVGKRVKILDPPNNIREAYLVMGLTVDITGGADVELELGAQATSLTASGAQRINEEAAAKREPTVLYRNSSPGTAQSSGSLGNVPDISAYNWIFIEVCWSTSYTSHRAGTWVYVPDGTSVIAHPSVDWYDSGAAHTYRQVTISREGIYRCVLQEQPEKRCHREEIR